MKLVQLLVLSTKNSEISLYLKNFYNKYLLQAICKPRHWNFSIGIGIGTNITSSITSTSIRSMDPKLSRVVTQDEVTPLTKSRDTSILWSRDNKKHYISTFTRPMDSKLNKVMTQDDGTPSTKSRGTSNAWSCDKRKTLYFYIKKVHVLQDLARRLKMRGLHPKDHVTVRSCSHVKIQKRHFFSTTRPMASKLSKMGTQIDGTSCAKPNNTSFSWSCYKDVISSLSRGLC